MSTPKGSGVKVDLSSIAGIVVALGGILGGLLLEGGNIKDVAQVTGAIIVLGGTLGAVLVTTPDQPCSAALHESSFTCSFSRSTLPAKSLMRLSSTPHALGAMESYRSNRMSNPSAIHSCKRLCRWASTAPTFRNCSR